MINHYNCRNRGINTLAADFKKLNLQPVNYISKCLVTLTIHLKSVEIITYCWYWHHTLMDQSREQVRKTFGLCLFHWTSLMLHRCPVYLIRAWVVAVVVHWNIRPISVPIKITVSSSGRVSIHVAIPDGVKVSLIHNQLE